MVIDAYNKINLIIKAKKQTKFSFDEALSVFKNFEFIFISLVLIFLCFMQLAEAEFQLTVCLVSVQFPDLSEGAALEW